MAPINLRPFDLEAAIQQLSLEADHSLTVTLKLQSNGKVEDQESLLESISDALQFALEEKGLTSDEDEALIIGWQLQTKEGLTIAYEYNPALSNR